MTTRAKLLALAERCEAATEPDRELDGEIACATFATISTDDNLIYRSPVRGYDGCPSGTYWHVERSGRSLQTAPVYTESIDAALTLLLPPYELASIVRWPVEQIWCVALRRTGASPPERVEVSGETIQGALLAAILGARRPKGASPQFSQGRAEQVMRVETSGRSPISAEIR